MGTTVRRQLGVLAEASGGKRPATCIQLLPHCLQIRFKARTRRRALRSPRRFSCQRQKGFALFYGPARQQFMMPMVREAGSWKVSQSIPIAYSDRRSGGRSLTCAANSFTLCLAPSRSS